MNKFWNQTLPQSYLFTQNRPMLCKDNWETSYFKVWTESKKSDCYSYLLLRDIISRPDYQERYCCLYLHKNPVLFFSWHSGEYEKDYSYYVEYCPVICPMNAIYLDVL